MPMNGVLESGGRAAASARPDRSLSAVNLPLSDKPCRSTPPGLPEFIDGHRLRQRRLGRSSPRWRKRESERTTSREDEGNEKERSAKAPSLLVSQPTLPFLICPPSPSTHSPLNDMKSFSSLALLVIAATAVNAYDTLVLSRRRRKERLTGRLTSRYTDAQTTCATNATSTYCTGVSSLSVQQSLRRKRRGARD